jgi:RNA polymerase sigma-70 factor (sigma-E family)
VPEDAAEFAAFVEGRQHQLLRAAYLVTGDRQLAEDLLQTALVKLAQRWEWVRDGNPEAYLRTVLYRDAVSWWRKHRREHVTASVPERSGPDPAEDTALRLAFGTALARLAPRQRAVLVLRYFEDQSEARTAEILGVAVGTVKRQAHDAIRRLREIAPELGELVETGRDTS